MNNVKMERNADLQKLIDNILEMNHTEEKWRELRLKTDTYLKELPLELENYFAQSGAGEALYMACSGFEILQDKGSQKYEN